MKVSSIGKRWRRCWIRGLSGIVLALVFGAGIFGRVSLAAAQEAATDGTITFKDLRGREHVDARLLRVDAGSMVVMTASGVAKLPLSIVPEDIRKKFGVVETVAPAPETPAAMPTTPAAEESAPNATPEPQAARPAIAGASQADLLQLSLIRNDINKYTNELRGLQNSRAQVQEEYKREFEKAKERVKNQFAADQEAFNKKAFRSRGVIDRSTIEGGMTSHTHGGRRYTPPPQEGDPHKDGQVVKLKGRLDDYDQQIKIREGWLKDLKDKERPFAQRMEDAERQAKADQERARREAEQKKIEDRYMEGRRLVAEREAKEAAREMELDAAEKAETEKLIQEKKARVEKFVADCAAIGASSKEGDLRSAYLKLEELKANRDGWDYPGGDGAQKIAAAAMDLFDLARQKNELAIANSSLGIAFNLDCKGAKFIDGLMRYFDEARVLVKAGDFPALSHHLEFIRTPGVQDLQFIEHKKHELSSMALDRGWEALKSFDFMTAGSAVETARRLWRENPRLGWLRTMVSASFFVGILLGLFGIFKGVEAIYWWSNRG